VSALLEVSDLSVSFATDGRDVHAVDRVSFAIEPGEVLGIVGESGSGKSVSMLALLGLIPCPPGRVSGRAVFRGVDLLALGHEARREIRGAAIAMIFQDPMTSLNPYLRVGLQMTEAAVHRGASRADAHRRAAELFERVGIPDPGARLAHYPHQFSGGQRQRIMIAMALMLRPALLIADEPTTALDVTIQLQILALLAEVRRDTGCAIALITHSLGVVAGTCDRVQVMYAGRLCETGPTTDVFARPAHPYTRGLLASLPRLDQPRGRTLTPIAGQPPDLTRLGPGCAFAPRCSEADARCVAERPVLEPVDARGTGAASPRTLAACWRRAEERAR